MISILKIESHQARAPSLMYSFIFQSELLSAGLMEERLLRNKRSYPSTGMFILFLHGSFLKNLVHPEPLILTNGAHEEWGE